MHAPTELTTCRILLLILTLPTLLLYLVWGRPAYAARGTAAITRTPHHHQARTVREMIVLRS